MSQPFPSQSAATPARRAHRHWQRARSLSFWAALALALALLLSPNVPWPALARAQRPLAQQLADHWPDLFAGDRRAAAVATDWVRLDGKPIIRIAAKSDELPARIDEIERQLWQASRDYLRDRSDTLNVEIRDERALPTLYVNGLYILTVTHLDAELYHVEPASRAQTVKASLSQALAAAQQERQPEHLRQQAAKALGLGVLASLLSSLLRRWQRSWQQARSSAPPHPERIDLSKRPNDAGEPAAGQVIQRITTDLTQKQRSNAKAVRRLLLQLLQVAIWLTAVLSGLALFPQTRPLQVWLLTRLQSYAIAIAVAIATYLAIRLSFVSIDRLIEAVLESAQLVQSGPRLHQRVSTISGVAKGTAAVLLSAIGILAALSSLGVNVGPLIAGAGLVGVAISLASQNLIRDAINGFLILVEDQYAVGDVIVVGEVFGRVERITLRMTQLRDPEERLIAIPNSEIKVVCNLTSHHAQADVQIPVAYSADIDQALALVQEVCDQMKVEPGWRELMLAEPNLLGLDDFSDRGMTIRVWIRTPPLKHWDVAREFRRRIKRAFDAAGIPLARTSQELWVSPDNRHSRLAADWADRTVQNRH